MPWDDDLDAERNALARVMQRQQPDALESVSAAHNSAGWWSGRVAELRACLAAGERFGSTGPQQIGKSEAQRAALQRPSEAAAGQAPA